MDYKILELVCTTSVNIVGIMTLGYVVSEAMSSFAFTMRTIVLWLTERKEVSDEFQTRR